MELIETAILAVLSLTIATLGLCIGLYKYLDSKLERFKREIVQELTTEFASIMCIVLVILDVLKDRNLLRVDDTHRLIKCILASKYLRNLYRTELEQIISTKSIEESTEKKT